MADLGSSTDVPVYTGIWTNWSRGYILGATLTLSHLDGALLTASLAIFITFVGTSFWRIASFALHQFLSTAAPKDGLYHQTQAALRNSETGSAIIANLFRALWAWRGKANRPLHRTITLLIVTGLSTALFTVASVFSASISTGVGNEVLISSPHCGRLYRGDPSVTDYDTLETVYYPQMSRTANSYGQYFQTCYTNVSEAQGCGSLIKKEIQYHRSQCKLPIQRGNLP